jgi:protein-tyrosine kinase
MSAHGPKLSVVERLAQRLEDEKTGGAEGRRAEGPSELAALRAAAAAKIAAQPSPPPPKKYNHIDLARLQQAGMFTPAGGRHRVIDEYRLIKRPILHNAVSGEKHCNLVMVTSAQPGEGKTFTAISLAMSVVAEESTQVLLVDLDIARQDVCRTLGIRSEVGLIDLLDETASSLSELLVQTDVPRLTVLPAGADRPLAHELLASPKMQSFMAELSHQYRDGLVIIDTAPVLVSTDTSVLTKNVGQVIMVVEANRTVRGSVQEAVSLVKGCAKISFLLNRVALSDLIHQYGTYYGHHYDREGPVRKASLLDRISTYVGKRWLRSPKSGGNL